MAGLTLLPPLAAPPGLALTHETFQLVHMSTSEIEQAIPHRPPMLLIDEIVSREESSIVCKKTFSADEFFVQGHFPGQPIVPGVIQCECCMQAGAILLHQRFQSQRFQSQRLQSQRLQDSEGGGSGDTVPVATRMDGVKFKRMVRPGDTVEIQVTLNDQVSQAYFLTGKMTLGGKLAMRLDFACTLSEADPNPSSTEPSS